MLRERILVVILLIPILAWIVATGGWAFTVVMTMILGLAAREYGLLFRRVHLKPSVPLLVVGTVSIGLVRFAGGFDDSGLILAFMTLSVMTWHLVDYERGADRSGSDFGITLSGVVYLGWMGAYLISLRELPDGQWWFLIVMPAVWFADSAAYIVGNWIGRHRLSPRLSPNKSWEGYIAGIIFGGIAGFGFTHLWMIGTGATSSLDAKIGLVVGLLVSTFAPLGDLGISMIKRELDVKDTGNLLPGHGGALDRIDSWIWAAAIGYYVIHWMTS